MARVSRNQVQIGTNSSVFKPIYHTAIYARLSIEDNGMKGDSIDNQISFIEKYICKQSELQYVDTFIDNGITGVNFDRPEFQRMIEAIRMGKIDCVVVKDLSRFGRNYLEAGEYLENLFPYLGVRFISVNDHYDSLLENSNHSLMISLKGILHDTYAKDISKKVCTAIDIKKKSGKFMGKMPPYGYIRSADDRFRLVVHWERAEVIKDIFQWRLDGMGVVAIAHRLNDLEIPSQLKLRWEEGYLDGKETALWHGSSVTDILRNPCYTGCMVERKGHNELYKGKPFQTIPRSEWKWIKDTHEAIIQEDTFQKVQKMMDEGALKIKNISPKNADGKRIENILSGLVVCGICGSRMQRDRGYKKEDGTLINHYFYCHRKYIKKGACSGKSVSEKDLIHTIFEVCKIQISLLSDIKSMIDGEENSNDLTDRNRKLQTEMEQLNCRFIGVKNKRDQLYVDFKNGLFSLEDYQLAKEKYNKEMTSIKRKYVLVQKQLHLDEDEPIRKRNWMREILQFETEKELTREMCLALIEKIVVKDDTFQIFFSFQSEYERAILWLKNSMDGGVSV